MKYIMKFQQYTAIPNNLKKYMGLQGNLCNENWDPAMRTGVPCNKNSCNVQSLTAF